MVMDSSLPGYHKQIELHRNIVFVFIVLLMSNYKMICFFEEVINACVDLLRILY